MYSEAGVHISLYMHKAAFVVFLSPKMMPFCAGNIPLSSSVLKLVDKNKFSFSSEVQKLVIFDLVTSPTVLPLFKLSYSAARYEVVSLYLKNSTLFSPK